LLGELPDQQQRLVQLRIIPGPAVSAGDEEGQQDQKDMQIVSQVSERRLRVATDATAQIDVVATIRVAGNGGNHQRAIVDMRGLRQPLVERPTGSLAGRNSLAQ